MHRIIAFARLLLLIMMTGAVKCDTVDNNTRVLGLARNLLAGTFNAGGGYADIWARDTNTFIEIALDSNPIETVRSVLLGFFCRQKEDGECPGGYTPHQNRSVCESAIAPPAGMPYHSCLGGTELCKNNAETDQESSIVLAVHKYVLKTKDVAFLSLDVNGSTILARCEMALDWLRTHRTDEATGLLWGGTTLDWGDVQPEEDLSDPRLLETGTHPAIDIYDNSMYVMALRAYVELARTRGVDASSWEKLISDTSSAVRRHLWLGAKFKPHLYMDQVAAAKAAKMAGVSSFRHGSPFNHSFNEDALNYHGGTACAAMANLLSKQEVLQALQVQLSDVQAINQAGGHMTIGLTIYPPYPNLKVMPAWTYQNGGDWAWFGGRMVTALIKYGLLDDAAQSLAPMVNRVVAHGGFWEWWGRDGKPSGSSLFHGAAGILGTAIVELQQARTELQQARTMG